MKRKCVAVGIILLFVGIGIIPSTAQDADKTSQPTSKNNWLYIGVNRPFNYTYNDVDIDIYAGAYGITNGNYGLGFVIGIANNLDENITGTIITYWNFTDSITVALDSASFNLSAHHPKIELVEIDWLHFPFPILKLTVIVKVNETSISISRSGIEIGPFVFFSH